MYHHILIPSHPTLYNNLHSTTSLTSPGLTALTLATEAYNVKSGDTILIHTVAGGLGLLFTALAKHRGATVIGTTSTPEKAAIAKSYGADHVILYTKEDTVKRVLEITGGEGVDAVFDGVGKDTFLANFDLLKRKGTLVAVGNASGPPDPISPLKLSPKNIKLVRPRYTHFLPFIMQILTLDDAALETTLSHLKKRTHTLSNSPTHSRPACSRFE